MSTRAGAVVTGAGRGLGRLIAQLLVERGYRVLVTDVDEAAAKGAATALGESATAMVVDVREEAQVHAARDRIVEVAGGLDVWVNNAGVLLTGPAWEQDSAARRMMLDVNALGTINGTVAAIDAMKGAGGGHIINIASLVGVSAYPGLATYCATKHAVVGFSEALRRELEPQGVLLSTVLPGVVRTELSSGLDAPRWTEPLTTVDASDVGDAIVEVIAKPRPRITVPKALGATLKATSALPARTQLWIERTLKLDGVFATAHGPERSAYHQRLKDQSNP